MPSRTRRKDNVMGMDKLQERTNADPGASEHAQTRTHCPQEPPIRANEEQVGKSEHEGSRRTAGIDGADGRRPSSMRKSKSDKGKRAA